MRSSACDDVCALIDREAIGWTEAERLRVEQHLGECVGCSETLSLSRFVRDTLKDAAGELSEAARGRAIQGALRQGGRRAHSLHAPRALPLWQVGVSLAAAAALLIWLVRAPEERAATPAKAPAPSAQTTKVATAPARVSEQAPAQTNVVVESHGRETHTFAHATVQLAPETRTRFDAATHTLTLERGALDVDVDPSKHATFSVVTDHFRVEVLGTRFSVTPDTVSVQHGRVRVVDADEAAHVRELESGQSYSVASRASASSARPTPHKPASTPSASALLSQARNALTHDDKAQARALVRAAEAARPSRAERAEAGTLHAEIALLERDSASALRAYRQVAQRYPELSAGENAAFAAAQLAAKSQPEQARSLLEAYLARYPRGRFVDEAKERLHRLDAR